MKNLLFTFFTFISLNTVAQNNIHSQEYFEGTINGNIEISFYLKIQEDGCPRVYASAIYRYKKNGENEWILLKSTFSETKQHYTFVEFFNTGILLLKKEKNSLNGIWISPDGKKQFDVKLNKVQIDKESIEKLENELEKENYEAYDC